MPQALYSYGSQKYLLRKDSRAIRYAKVTNTEKEYAKEEKEKTAEKMTTKMATKMIHAGKPDEEIMEFTELTKEQLEKLKKQLEED